MVGVNGRTGKNSKAVREFKAAGNKAMHAGAFQKAMRLYTKALDLDAGNAVLYSNRSAAHFNTRQFSESLEDAESAILCDPMWWKAYKRKGLALIHMQRYEEAIEALEEGLKIVGKNAEMEKNLEFARACQEQAQNLYILPEPHMMQRLESVPVFIVTDNVGQPFFVTYDDGQQVCTFYFDQEDAISTLDWIKSENPDLGDTARVIHITLHQAFNLAQETQKQYYEETTRAAAEEDIRAAAEAAAKKKAEKEGVAKESVVVDVDGEEEDDMEESKDFDSDGSKEGTTEPEASDAAVPDAKVDEATDAEVLDISGQTVTSPSEEGNTASSGDNVNASKDKDGTEEKEDEKKDDDGVIDENAPLSFQFRPELRQVQVAVELLNKHPNPPVRPILRDPPSVRKAKAEAAAAAAAATAEAAAREESDGGSAAENSAPTERTAEEGGTTKQSAVGAASEQSPGAVKAEHMTGSTAPAQNGINGDAKSAGRDDPTSGADRDGEKPDENKIKTVAAELEDDDDVELTVDNFNGIPIFQAKGLTLLQKNKQLVPLFFSKWDLEDAWKQLKESNAADVPGECEIEVGTLEDVLRRMSESKTDEFQSVFFVPSRESMKAINVKFPLDDLASSNPAARRGMGSRPAVRKAGFSRAKQIAARGGTKEEIRAAIREDLEKHRERQRMAEIIAQIEQAGRTGSLSGLGRVPSGAGSSGANGLGKSKKSPKSSETGDASTTGGGKSASPAAEAAAAS